jgi:hypothetical protein
MQTNQVEDLKTLLQRLEIPCFVIPPNNYIQEETTKSFYIKDPDDPEGMELMEKPRLMFLQKFKETAVIMCSQKDECEYQVRFYFNTKEIGNFSMTTHIKNREHWVKFRNNYNGEVSDIFRAPGDGGVGSKSSVYGFGIEFSTWFNMNYSFNIDQYHKRLRNK